MDISRDYLSGKITGFANYIDRFFGGDRHYQESNRTVFQLDFTRAMGYGVTRHYDFAARMNLRLPVTEGRLHLLVETDPEKNIAAETTPAQVSPVLPNQVAAPPGVALAVRVEKAKEERWHFSTDGGLKFHGPAAPAPFVRTRGSFTAPMGEWRLKAAESVYWFSTIGAGETSQLDLEHIISAPVLFRATSTATWLRDKSNFDLRQDLSFFHALSDRTALLYQASIIGVSNPQSRVSDYVVLLNYRYRLHREWQFLDISPQLHFPAERNYRASGALLMRLEILFDESR